MSMHLVEGESFPQDYNLDKKLTDSGDQSVWLATNRQTGDRVVVRAFLTPIEDNEWQSLVSRVENLKGLLHEGITSVRTASTDAGIQYLLEPYIPGAQPFIPDAKSLWPSIHSLLDALAFAHNLGIPHGNLHSGNLLITPDSKTHITGFGVPGHASIPNEWQSPQIKAGNPAAVSDDIYSIGCLLFKAFTGSEWSDLSLARGELDQPLPAELESLVKSMIAESPFNRPTDIDSVLDTLASYFARPDDSIESIDFARPEQVSPVDSDIPSIETRHKPSIPAGVAFGALAFIIAAASLLFLLLPTEPAEISEIQQQVVPAQASTTPGSSTSQGAPTKGPSPYRAAELAFFKEESERLTREILRYQLDLEDQGARLWAGDNLNSIDTAVQSAEQAFRDEDYSAALEQYQSIHQSLAALVEQIPAQLEFEVSRGEQALNDGDSRTAIEAFTIALAIEKRADILNNLDRAEQLEEVMSLVRKAEMFERDGELDEALSSFQSAYSMDGQWGPAIEGVARVEASIQSRQFRQAMSEAFQAIAGKDYDGARSACITHSPYHHLPANLRTACSR